MFRTSLLFFFAALLFCSCSSSRKNTSSPGGAPAIEASRPKAGDDGLSYATAIVITETSETTGIKAEYDWIKQHYPGYKTQSQALNYKDKKPYDVISIKTSDGKDQKVYFDISNFYGKF